MTARGVDAQALWVSAFRPFYLLGAAYLPWAVAAGAWAWSGGAASDAGGLGRFALAGGAALWHGHEMLYGFALAIVTGTVLTALPSWAGTPEVRGPPLRALAVLWLLGRLACNSAGFWPPGAAAAGVALLDSALPLALLVLLTPQLTRGVDRRYALLLPVLAVLALANFAFHAAVAARDAAAASAALRAALWALVVLFSLKGGVLTPVFTGNVLVARGRGAPAAFSLPLESAALLSLVALALAALATQGWRVARWRGWRAADEPLVAAMNLGFVWLLAALALKAAAALGAPSPEPAWVHAFTLGALGAMMLGLMTRVALRHTGRALVAPRALGVALLLVSAAAALRVAAAVHGLGPWAPALAGGVWVACFAGWLAKYAGVLVAPSLSRG